jgi:prevent-host-death family protein
MPRFSLTDLSKKPSKVLEAASKGPVDIACDGERQFVLLTADTYDRLSRSADTRRAFHADDEPTDLAARMLSALESDG